MDDAVESQSDTSSEFEGSDDCQSPNFNVTQVHIDQKVLSTQQVFEVMEGEVNKVCEVTGVSKRAELVRIALAHLSYIVLRPLPAVGEQSATASQRFQMGHRETARDLLQRWPNVREHGGKCVETCRL